MILAEGTGLVGLYEAEPDYALARGLLDEAAGFLKQQNCSSIWGPIDFSIWHNYRFKTDCFEEAVFIGEPENPPHYPEHFLNYGFTVTHTWETHIIDRAGMQAVCESTQGHFELLKKLGFQVEPAADMKFMTVCWELIADIFNKFPGYAAITQEQFQELYREMPYLIEPRASFLVRNPVGSYAGFKLVLKDLVAAVRATNGKTGPFAKLKFMMRRGSGTTANFYLTGFRHAARIDAVGLAKKKYNAPLSAGRAMLHYGLREILKAPGYQFTALTLMRPEVPTCRWVKDLAVRKMHHCMYSLNL
jgi:hypothetical protein